MKKRKSSKKNKDRWLYRLLDSNDHSMSASTVFLFITSIIAIILLLVPAIAILIEVCYNHTITTDLAGMAQYIGSVAAILVSGGILKGWTSYSREKFTNLDPSNIINLILKTISKTIDSSTLEDSEDSEEEFDPNDPYNG